MKSTPIDQLKTLLPEISDYVSSSRWFRRVFVAVTVIAIVLGPPFIKFLNHETQLTLFMLIIILILGFLWDSLSRLTGGASIQFFSDATLAQNALLDIARRNPKATKALAVHYSGQNINHIILELQNVPSIGEINIFLQHPNKAVSPEQADKIRTMARTMSRQWHQSKVHVWYYCEPASVRGILIGDVALCIGWYTYQNAQKEGTLIWGHNTGAVLVNRDSEGFAPLRDFFLQVVGNLSNTDRGKDEDDTVSLEQLLQEIDNPPSRKDKTTPSS